MFNKNLTISNQKNRCAQPRQRGSALLVALLVVGVLMVVTLGLTDLIIREMRLQADVSKAGKAYYAAEAGIEQALLQVHQGLPGVEKQNETGVKFSDDTAYKYSIHGLSTSVPDLSNVNYGSDLAKTFKPLRQNESVTIPMFYQDKDGNVKHTKHFYVAYYMQPLDLNLKDGNNFGLNDFDVLRWKIFGLSSAKRTESISDYISVGVNDTAQTPRCFGTQVDNGSKVKCQPNATQPAYTNVGGEQIVSCPLTAARTYYAYDASGNLDKSSLTQQCYPLTGFFNNHDYNYLVLTNAVNLDMIKKSKTATDTANNKEKVALATIYYKVVAMEDDNFPLNDVKITSTGILGDIEQAIEVNVGRDQFLPVFNFSLYRFDAKK